jgi:PAS domain S-box-containing protein
MKVQNRLLILWLLLGLFFLAGFLILQRSQVENLGSLVSQRQQDLEQLLSRIIELEGQSQATLTFDYTYWDELVDFVQTQDPTWAQDVLYASLNSYNVQVIWVYNVVPEMVHISTAIPDQVNSALPLTQGQIQNLFSSTPYVRFNYVLPDGTVMEVHGASIHPSNDVAHSSPPRGYFFTGRLWNRDRLDYLSSLSGANLTIVPADRASTISTGPEISNDINVLYNLRGLDGNPIGVIDARFPNRYFQGYLSAQQRDLTAYALFVGGFFLISLIALAVWIGLPLRTISNSLANQDTRPLHSLQKNRSEFGHISRLIHDFFLQKQQLNEDFQNQSKIEAALRLSEERYRTISELISDAAFSFRISPANEIIPEWGTDGIARISGYEFDQISNRDQILQMTHPEDVPMLMDSVSRLQQGQPVEFEVRITARDGSLHWMRLNLSASLDEFGRVVKVYGAARDITIERLAQEAYRALVNNALQGLIIIQAGEVAFVNQTMLELTGYPSAELTGEKIKEIIAYPGPGSEVASASGDSNPSLVRKEASFIHRDGTTRWIEISILPITYQSLPAEQISCVDITGRHLAQQALEEQQQYSTKLLDMIHSMVIVLDGIGRIVDFNPATERILGKSADAIRQHSFWELFNLPASSPLSESNFGLLLAEQRSIRDLDTLLKIDNNPVWLSWSVSYLNDRHNTLSYLVLFGADITERKMRERQQQAIANIATMLRSRATRTEVLQTIIEEIYNLVQAETCGIAFRTPDQQHLYVEVINGRLAEQMRGRHVPMSSTVSENVILTGQPYLTNNVFRETPATAANASGLPVQSVLWFPLQVDTANVGLLVIADSGEIHPSWLAVLQPVAEIAASAIHRTSLSEETQRRLQHLTALHTINIAIGASLDLRMTLNVLANQITTQLGVDAVDILMLNPHNRSLEYTAGHGFRNGKEIEKLRLWVGEGQAGRVALERRSRHLFDPDGIEGYFISAKHLEGEGFVAYHAIPLVVKGEVKGVIETFHRPPYLETSGWQELLESLALETAIAIDNAELVEKLQRGNLELQIAYDATIEGWARALELRDQETEGHTRRVANMTVLMAQGMGISGNQLMHIRRGALLHDIGKMGIPDSILLKPGKLDENEWVVMRQHPTLGHEMLVVIPFLRPALDIPLSHHERWDGQGYPQGLSGEQIPLAARIFAVIDVWDALSNPRIYRPYALPQDEIITYLTENSGIRFDPKVIEAFMRLHPVLSRQE